MRVAAALVALALAGCSSAPGTAVESAAQRRGRWLEQAPSLLTPQERVVLNAIEGEEARVQYLAEIGVVAELELNRRLRKGQTMPEVEQELGPPEDRETEWQRGELLEYWTYRDAPAPAIELRSVLQFRDGRLVDWKVVRPGG